MRDVLRQVIERGRTGPVVLARVVGVTGAGPRAVGAAMLVTADGEVIGSLSGGCVEAAVLDSADCVLLGGVAVLEQFGLTDDEGFTVGLSCGGEMEIFIERIEPERVPQLETLERDILSGRPVALVTTLDESPEWQLIDPAAAIPPVIGTAARATGPTASATGAAAVATDTAAPVIGRDALQLARAGGSGVVGLHECLGAGSPRRAFVHSFGPPARMILAGANDFVRALSRLGVQLGYRVTVVDARETFTTPARFPAAHEVVVEWPHRYLRREHERGRIDARTVVCALTHDTKFDVPMLAAALAIEPLAFIGALGSRRTDTDRRQRLLDAGVPPGRISRLRSPIGLDLNAHTPDQTAVSIAAQIIAEAGGASARPLAETDGPIHH
ncbi:XdhC family protein [Nocardia sp. NPDC088792]|uniref:XdhC family protein n=1 Tax=Nocardia sp. NPDC088792 TaxID=3364332 RepID=UPI0037FB7C8F